MFGGKKPTNEANGRKLSSTAIKPGSKSVSQMDLTDMPPPEELEKQFLELLDDYNMTGPQRDMLLKKSGKDKWMFIKLKREEEESDADSPQKYVNTLRDGKVNFKVVEQVAMLLRTKRVRWIKRFLELGGLNAVIELLISTFVKAKKKSDDHVMERQCILCLKNIMNSKPGMAEFINEREVSSTVSVALQSQDMEARYQTLVILASACHVSEAGFWLALESMNAFKAKFNESKRFHNLISVMTDPKAEPEYKYSAFVVVNSLVSTPEQAVIRRLLKKEFLDLGIMDAVQSLKLKEALDHEGIAKQIQIFEEEIEESQEETVLDEAQILQAIKVSLGSCPQAYNSFKFILQFFKNITENAKDDASKQSNWEKLEKVIAKCVNIQTGTVEIDDSDVKMANQQQYINDLESKIKQLQDDIKNNFKGKDSTAEPSRPPSGGAVVDSEEMRKVQKEADELRHKLQEAQGIASGLEHKNGEMIHELQRLEKALVEVKTELTTKDNTVEALKQEKTKLALDLEDVKSKLERLNITIAEKDTEIAHKQAELKKEKDAREHESEQLRKQIMETSNSSSASTNAVVTMLQEQLAQTKGSLGEVEKKLEAAESQRKTIEQAKQAAEESKAAAEKGKATAEQEKKDIETKLNKLEAELKGLQDQKKRLEDDKKKLETDKTALDTKVRAAEDKAKQAETKLKTAEDRAKAAEAKAAQPAQPAQPAVDVKKLQTTIDEQTKKIKDLEDKLKQAGSGASTSSAPPIPPPATGGTAPPPMLPLPGGTAPPPMLPLPGGTAPPPMLPLPGGTAPPPMLPLPGGTAPPPMLPLPGGAPGGPPPLLPMPGGAPGGPPPLLPMPGMPGPPPLPGMPGPPPLPGMGGPPPLPGMPGMPGPPRLPGMGPPGMPGMPGMPAMAPAAPQLPTNKPKGKVKQFHWVQIPKNKVAVSIFAKKDMPKNTFETIKKLDLNNLEEMFAQKAATQAAGGGGAAESNKKEVVSLIDAKKSQNASLILGSMRIDAAEVKRCILTLDEAKFSLQNVKSLSTIAPTAEEIEAVTSYSGDVSNLAQADRFYREIGDIPRIDKRLNCWLFKRNFPTKISEIKPSIENVNAAINELQNSKSFLRVLETILTIGNFLNAGSAKGNTMGFKMETLLKLNDTRSADNKTTLLQWIALHFQKNEPELLKFPEDISHVEPATKVVVSIVQAEIADIRKGLKEIDAEIEAAKESHMANDRFAEVMTEFKEKAQQEFSELEQGFENMNKDIGTLAELYSEDPKSIKPEEFFKMAADFAKMFDAAHKLNLKNQEAEEKAKKKAEAEAAAKNKKAASTSDKKDEAAADGEKKEKGIVDGLEDGFRDGSAFRNRRGAPGGAKLQVDLNEVNSALSRRNKK